MGGRCVFQPQCKTERSCTGYNIKSELGLATDPNYRALRNRQDIHPWSSHQTPTQGMQCKNSYLHTLQLCGRSLYQRPFGQVHRRKPKVETRPDLLQKQMGSNGSSDCSKILPHHRNKVIKVISISKCRGLERLRRGRYNIGHNTVSDWPKWAILGSKRILYSHRDWWGRPGYGMWSLGMIVKGHFQWVSWL